MDVKLIVMDMDGTLLNSDKEISKLTYEKLMELQAKGIRCCLASGRSKNRQIDSINELELDKYNGFVIEGNGVAYHNFKTDQHHEIQRCSKSELQEMIDHIKHLGSDILIMAEQDAYVILAEGRETCYWLDLSEKNNIKHRNVYFINSIDEIEQKINKICICEELDLIDVIYERLESIDDKYWYGKILPYWIEVTRHDITKGNALKKIMKDNNFSKEEVLVFGDGENDISMLTVGTGIAMSNALDSVKQVCYDVCDDNNSDGIAKYLIKLGY